MKTNPLGKWRPDKGQKYMTVSLRDVPGITAKIYRQVRKKGEAEYVSFILSYSLLRERKLEAHSKLEAAQKAGEDAIRRIASGQQEVLTLSNSVRTIYQRAQAVLEPLNIPLDIAAMECVETRTILNGYGTPQEAARYFVEHRAKELPRITVPDAVSKCLAQARADGKSVDRMHQLEHYLNGFAENMNVEVGELTPGIISRYLTGMVASERTKKNCRDVLGHFGRWLVLHGYLKRGTDLLENVQRYSMKSAEIHIFTPEEVTKLLSKAGPKLLPYIAIGAFAGLRGREIQRLDWSEVDLAEGFIEVKAEKAKTETRRLVPIKPNLKAWLEKYRKQSGRVCPYRNVVNQLMKLVAKVNESLPKRAPESERILWKKNALRHSYIYYRVAECADVPRVADESGNSVGIIKSNYLKRVKPDAAAVWFGIMPTKPQQQRGRKIVRDAQTVAVKA